MWGKTLMQNFKTRKTASVFTLVVPAVLLIGDIQEGNASHHSDFSCSEGSEGVGYAPEPTPVTIESAAFVCNW